MLDFLKALGFLGIPLALALYFNSGLVWLGSQILFFLILNPNEEPATHCRLCNQTLYRGICLNGFCEEGRHP